MKILFILPEYYPHSGGGISTYYLHYIKALKNEVDEIRIMVGSGYTQSDENFNVDGISVEYLKPAIFKSYLPKFSKFNLTPEYRNNMAAAWAMWEQSNQGECYDIIECTDFGLGFVPWLVDKSKPVIVRLHGSAGQIDLFETKFKAGLSADLHRQTELILLGFADKLISHSTANKVYWESILQKKDVELVYPIYNNIQSFVPFNQKENYGIVCGRVQDWKGPDILCKALALLKGEKPLVKWYGRDTSFDGKINKTTQLKKDYPKVWGTQILHEQPLPNSAIIEIQNRAKFAIIPSTWDMFNFTGLEHLSTGTVLICSQSAGVSELIENEVNGFTYHHNSPVELAKCIDALLKIGEEEYEQLVENGSLIFSTKLDTNKIIDANLQLYKKVINNTAKLNPNPFHGALYEPSNEKYTLKESLKNVRLKSIMEYTFARIFKKT